MIRVPKINGERWLNSRVLTEHDLAGKVILIDFWTFSCVNCLRTLPYLKDWWAKYQKFPFLIIGVHTPEFEFERDFDNVSRAVKDLGVTWPVVLDNDYLIWESFANRFWPAHYLVDTAGRIAYRHYGEGEYAKTEAKIQALLKTELGINNLPEITTESESGGGGLCFIPTPETYCGYLRGTIANQNGYVIGRPVFYEPPAIFKNDSIALAGKFLAKPEYIETQNEGATVLLNFMATEVNVVMSGDSAHVKIQLDGQDLPNNLAGDDVTKSGEVLIREPRMYNILRSDNLVQGILALTATKGNFRAYAFTFSGCKK